jgi:hypothetical protein
MYMFNTYRWDYPQVAALVAPRPLLISNTDSDSIFPLDGVYRTFEAVRRIYRLHNAADNVALQITAGGHSDTQELRIHAFRWFNHHLKGDDSLIDVTAEKLFEPEQLRVFDRLPAASLNADVQENFVPVADPPLPNNEAEWNLLSSLWMQSLRDKTFAAWPAENVPLDVEEVFSVNREGLTLRAVDFTSQEEIRLRLYLVHRSDLETAELVVLNAVDEFGYREFLATTVMAFAAQLTDEMTTEPDPSAFKQLQGMLPSTVMAFVAPRGIGPTAWNQTERKQIQHRRRFYLLGQSLDGMRVWDVRRAVQAVRSAAGMQQAAFFLQATGPMAGVALYASLFEPGVARLNLYRLPTSHRAGPYLLNVRRFMDLPQAVALASTKSGVVLYQTDENAWGYARSVASLLGRKDSIQIRKPVPD